MKTFMLVMISVVVANMCVVGCSESRDGLVAVRQSPAPTRMSSASGRASEQGDSDVLFGYVTPTDPRYNITLNEFREHVNNNSAVIIDARGPVSYGLGHVRGALNFPAGMIESYWPKIRESVAPDQSIIIYCNSQYCESSDRVYEFLASQGYTNMRVFKPGWQVLSSANDLR